MNAQSRFPVRPLVAFVLLLAGSAAAECPAPGTLLFPGVNGVALQESLRVNFRPPVGLTYAEARDVLYTEIDNHGGELRGIYTGFTIQLDPMSTSPRADALALGINAEHTWPQSRGAGTTPMRADMHHLFPSEIQANADRGSWPFAEIPDVDTDTWYRLLERTSMPDFAVIDEYSERDVFPASPQYDFRWEPREDHKGDTARAMFYFWTVYRNEAQSADPLFFDIQKDDLRAWHDADPVDVAEYDRTCAIAPYQDDKPNPFVIDPTLVDRAYFGGTPVRLLAFSAEATLDGVRLDWTVGEAEGHAGFHVLRDAGAGEERLTDRLLDGGPEFAFLDPAPPGGRTVDYVLEAVARDGSRERFGPRTVTVPAARFRPVALPNPSRTGTVLRVAGSATAASAALYDLRGRRIRSWEGIPAGGLVWDGADGAGIPTGPGVYFLRLHGPEGTRTLRVVRIR